MSYTIKIYKKFLLMLECLITVSSLGVVTRRSRRSLGQWQAAATQTSGLQGSSFGWTANNGSQGKRQQARSSVATSMLDGKPLPSSLAAI